MLTHLSCPNCQSRRVHAVRNEADSTPVVWQCQNCGQTSTHLREHGHHSAGMDIAVGLAVLVGMLTFAVALCLT